MCTGHADPKLPAEGGLTVLVTGATGKVGQQFIGRFLADERWSGARVRALCHNRLLEESERLQVVRQVLEDEIQRVGLSAGNHC